MNDNNNNQNDPTQPGTHGGGAQEGQRPGFNDMIKDLKAPEKPGTLLDALKPAGGVDTSNASSADVKAGTWKDLTGKDLNK